MIESVCTERRAKPVSTSYPYTNPVSPIEKNYVHWFESGEISLQSFFRIIKCAYCVLHLRFK